MPKLIPVRICLNGEPREALVEPAASLLQVVRDIFGMPGTKEGCGTGYCGACTVLLDGQPVNACLTFAVDADHRDVLTVEGLASREGELHPVQAAFVECGALQCGYCTPGMLLSTLALLRRVPAPTETDIRESLAGNLCRCTGYRSIVRAVERAAAALAAQPDPCADPVRTRPRVMRSRA
jgi:aerobic-type carbon monoxide dehydrogenase small subunit (CoxS/CutS family)